MVAALRPMPQARWQYPKIAGTGHHVTFIQVNGTTPHSRLIFLSYRAVSDISSDEMGEIRHLP